MKIINIDRFSDEDLYLCKDEKIRDILTENNILYINYINNSWVYIKSNDLINALNNINKNYDRR